MPRSRGSVTPDETLFCRDLSLVDGFWLQYGRVTTHSSQSNSRYPGFSSKDLDIEYPVHAEIPKNCPLSLYPGK